MIREPPRRVSRRTRRPPLQCQDRYSELSNAERPPDAAEVEAELRRVIDSRCFEQAGRAKEFLRFVVGETLAGRGDRLKGYTDRRRRFRSAGDSMRRRTRFVRVEARRLRSRLLELLLDRGRARPRSRIELPRGGYAPRFAMPTRGAARACRCRPESQPVSRPRAPRRLFRRVGGHRGRWSRALAFAQVARRTGLPFSDRSRRRGIRQTVARRRPTVLVPTFLNLSGDVDFEYFYIRHHRGRRNAARRARSGGRARGGFARRAAAHGSDPPTSGVDAEYVLTGSVQPAPDRIRVAARVSWPRIALNSGPNDSTNRRTSRHY